MVHDAPIAWGGIAQSILSVTLLLFMRGNCVCTFSQPPLGESALIAALI